MEESYLLSIVIPTKNRQDYALKCIEHILAIDDYRLQIVIQDNGDTMLLKEMLDKNIKDSRVKYSYVKGVLSFVDNFSLAIEQADAKYICMIGDDDGVNPNIMAIIEWADKNNIEAIKPELRVDYIWPNSGISGTSSDGSLAIQSVTKAARCFNPQESVVKFLRNGCINYLSFNMVKLYHGVVRKSCLDQIKKLTGHYFGGLTPDIYAAVALSSIVDKAIQIDYPLTIAGTCKTSGSADASTGRHTGKLEDAPHFRGHDHYEWKELVPKIYSVETIWADSALAALIELQRIDLTKEFNVLALFKECIKKYPHFEETIVEQYTELKHGGKLPQGSMETTMDYYRYAMRKFTKRVINKSIRIKNRLLRSNRNETFKVGQIENISQAANILLQRLDSLGVSVSDAIQSMDSSILSIKRDGN